MGDFALTEACYGRTVTRAGARAKTICCLPVRQVCEVCLRLGGSVAQDANFQGGIVDVTGLSRLTARAGSLARFDSGACRVSTV